MIEEGIEEWDGAMEEGMTAFGGGFQRPYCELAKFTSSNTTTTQQQQLIARFLR